MEQRQLALSGQTPRSMKDLKGLEWMAALTGWLRTFARHYPRAADNPWGAEDLEIYGRGLQELSLTDLNRKIEAVMKTCGSFAPTVGQILEASPAEPLAEAKHENCPLCWGTGYTESRDGHGRWIATPCKHEVIP